LKRHHAGTLAAIVTAFAMTAFAVVSDAIKPRHFFGSPVLYVLLVLSWVIGFPLFAVLHRWLKARLVCYLLCGGAGARRLRLAVDEVGRATTLQFPSAARGCGYPMVGAFVFWAVLRLSASEEDLT
jgi:hypothetical protein